MLSGLGPDRADQYDDTPLGARCRSFIMRNKRSGESEGNPQPRQVLQGRGTFLLLRCAGRNRTRFHFGTREKLAGYAHGE